MITKEQWADGLINGGFNQTYGTYIKRDRRYEPIAFCALGVAAYLDEDYYIGDLDNEDSDDLINKIFDKSITIDYLEHIIHMNDDEGLSLPEIGDIIKNDQVLERAHFCNKCKIGI